MNNDRREIDINVFENFIISNQPYVVKGKITGTKGNLYKAYLPNAELGASVSITNNIGKVFKGEIVSIEDYHCFIMSYTELTGISRNSLVEIDRSIDELKINENFLGRVIDFSGKPIDNKGPIEGDKSKVSIYGEPLNPMQRPPVRETLDTGVNAINSFITSGKGQRVAIMAGSGVGKSVLMGMIAKNMKADVNVIALIGERGREVLEFIEDILGEEGLRRSVVIVATSDVSALIRVKAAYTATAVAEYFRDKNKDVILMMDSITRFAMANREISLSAGEPPSQKGYTPSVFAKLPKLMERCGTKKNKGTITGFYTVLVEGDDMEEPIADAVRAISDGHIVLSRELAARNHYPAIDILTSISRVMNQVVKSEHKIVSSHLRDLVALYKESEDLIKVGAYTRGTNKKLDKAIAIIDDINNLLRQPDLNQVLTVDEVFDIMVEIAKKAEESVKE
jgi:flagellum-specific ATP synthase